MENDASGWHGTTILSVRKGGKVVVAGDGQVSLGNTVITSPVNGFVARRAVETLGAETPREVVAAAEQLKLFEVVKAQLRGHAEAAERAAVTWPCVHMPASAASRSSRGTTMTGSVPTWMTSIVSRSNGIAVYPVR